MQTITNNEFSSEFAGGKILGIASGRDTVCVACVCIIVCGMLG